MSLVWSSANGAPRRLALFWVFLGLGFGSTARRRLGGFVPAAADQDDNRVQVPADRTWQVAWPPVAVSPGTVMEIDVSSVGGATNEGASIIVLTFEQYVELASWQPKPLNVSGDGRSISGYVPSSWRHPVGPRFSARYNVSLGPDYFLVLVFNPRLCALDLTISITFTGPHGEHLPLEYRHFATASWGAAFAFALLTGCMVLLMKFGWHGPSTGPQCLLVACMLWKVVSLVLQARYYDTLNSDGDAPLWLFQAWRLAMKAHDINEMFLLLLISLGWRMLRPQLSSVELRSCTVTAFTATFLGVVEALSSMTDELEALLSYIVQVACYMVTIFMISFNLQVIQLNLAESPVSTSVAGMYYKKQAYVRFRWAFIAIIFRPSCRTWLRLIVIRGLDARWAVQAFDEAYLLAVYVALIGILRPTPPRHGMLDLVKAIAGFNEPAGTLAAGTVAESQVGDEGYVLLQGSLSEVE